jgi:SAM-dependent methyltransferase
MTLWYGELPEWMPQFQERIDANPLVDWTVLRPHTLDVVNERVSAELETPCRKATGYSLGDLRPMLAKLFSAEIEGYDWWGWCDFDIVLGNLNCINPQTFEDNDIITSHADYINGAFTLLKNTPALNNLFLSGRYKGVLENPDYCNFDETGFSDTLSNGNPSFTEIVRQSGFKVCYDDRSWNEGHSLIQGEIPSRCCEIVNGKLLEVPTGRELLMYHFHKKPKTWPIPNRYVEFIEDQKTYEADPKEAVPIESLEFWEDRILNVVAYERPIHEIAYDTSLENWQKIQKHTVELIQRHVKRRDRILDAGCNYGPLLDCLQTIDREVNMNLSYVGVDIVPKLIQLAIRRYNWKRIYFDRLKPKFVVADICKLPFKDKEFNWCFCRALEGSTRTNLGNGVWDQMQAEMLRVAKKLILVNLECEYRIVTS